MSRTADRLKTTPLHPEFGVEVHDVDLRDVTADRMYPAIRALFERHSLLLFAEQHLDDREHLAFGRLFGPIEDRSNTRMDGKPRISYGVSNETEDGGVCDEDDLRLLGLKANMLWHTDSTFLPTPALANVLQARVVPLKGGATEFVSTRAGFRALEPAMQQRLRGMTFRHRYSHSRARIDPDLAKLDLFTMWPDTEWRAVWRNPATGAEAVYVASHAFAASDMDEDEGQTFIDDLIERMTGPSHVYAHHWRPGNVLVWDERATLHRGTSWPYDQARTLVSCCISAGEGDGLSTMRP
ncbi:MAG: TauD/TfdA family dioxygenase [bacterium]|nr:TauD/TfdA family dioxygenase [bacterium]